MRTGSKYNNCHTVWDLWPHMASALVWIASCGFSLLILSLLERIFPYGFDFSGTRTEIIS